MCEANCDPQGFLLALSAYSSAEMARARTWSSIQEKFGVAVSCPLGTGGELLRYSYPEHLPIVRICCAMYFLNSSLRFSSSKFDLSFYWRIHCDETGRVQQSARLMPNIVDTGLPKCVENVLNFAPSLYMTRPCSRKNVAILMKLSAMFGKLANTVGIGSAIKDILSRC
jgi:hypothetical protein